MQTVDLIVTNIGQLITCASPNGVRRGMAMRDLGVIINGGLAVLDGQFVAVGNSAEITTHYQSLQTIDAQNQTIIPGLVDSHTHIVFGGNRVAEFELRIQGASYIEIMAAGGGILNTMHQTRAARQTHLFTDAMQRLDTMLALGSTTVEIKTGYGLDIATELKLLQTIAELDQSHLCRIVPTFLGAHTLPPEYTDNAQAYVALVINEMIPAMMAWYKQSHFSSQHTPFFIDVFCEDHAFTVAQTQRILQAGITSGMQAKIHVDQFNALGGLEMALELGAISADHLEVTATNGITALSNSQTIATILPAANFNLGQSDFANGRALIDAGTALALATDMNPGSAPCFSLPLTMAIACRYQQLLPSEALTACTINAAHALSLGDTVGSIEIGKSADFLILNTNDYRNLTYLLGNNLVKTVYISGTTAHS